MSTTSMSTTKKSSQKPNQRPRSSSYPLNFTRFPEIEKNPSGATHKSAPMTYEERNEFARQTYKSVNVLENQIVNNKDITSKEITEQLYNDIPIRGINRSESKQSITPVLEKIKRVEKEIATTENNAGVFKSKYSVSSANFKTNLKLLDALKGKYPKDHEGIKNFKKWTHELESFDTIYSTDQTSGLEFISRSTNSTINVPEKLSLERQDSNLSDLSESFSDDDLSVSSSGSDLSQMSEDTKQSEKSISNRSLDR